MPRMAELAGRGVDVSDVQEFPWGSFVFFSDPDGNGWAVQQLPPSRVGSAMMDLKLELVLIPVSDVDRAKAFYTEKLGFALDVDTARTRRSASCR